MYIKMIGFRINKDDKDIEDALLQLPEKKRSQAIKNAYRKPLNEKNINDIKELMIENNNVIKKILDIISNYNMPVVIRESPISADTTESTTNEE